MQKHQALSEALVKLIGGEEPARQFCLEVVKAFSMSGPEQGVGNWIKGGLRAVRKLGGDDALCRFIQLALIGSASVMDAADGDDSEGPGAAREPDRYDLSRATQRYIEELVKRHGGSAHLETVLTEGVAPLIAKYGRIEKEDIVKLTAPMSDKNLGCNVAVVGAMATVDYLRNNPQKFEPTPN